MNQGDASSSDKLSMRTDAMLKTAQFLGTQVDQLEAELTSITRQWSDLTASWTGNAATSFGTHWDDWHQAATTVTAILSDSSDLLIQSVQLMAQHEQEATAALSLGSDPRAT